MLNKYKAKLDGTTIQEHNDDLTNIMNQIEDKKIDKGINYDILDEFVRVLKKINIYMPNI